MIQELLPLLGTPPENLKLFLEIAAMLSLLGSLAAILELAVPEELVAPA